MSTVTNQGVVFTHAGFDVVLDDRGRFTSTGTKATYSNFDRTTTYETAFTAQEIRDRIDAEQARREQERARKKAQAAGQYPHAVLITKSGDVLRVKVRGTKKDQTRRLLVTLPDGTKATTDEGALSMAKVYADMGEEDLTALRSLVEMLSAASGQLLETSRRQVRPHDQRFKPDVEATFDGEQFVWEGYRADSLLALDEAIRGDRFAAAAPFAVVWQEDDLEFVVVLRDDADARRVWHPPGAWFATHSDADAYAKAASARAEASAALDAFVARFPFDYEALS